MKQLTWNTGVAGGIGVATLVGCGGWFAVTYLLDTLTTVLTVTLWVVGGAAMVLLLASAVGGAVMLLSRAWTILVTAREQARREALETVRQQLHVAEQEAVVAQRWRDAQVLITTAPADHQVIITERGGAMWHHRPAHLAPGGLNGAPVPIQPEEAHRWSVFQATHSTSKSQQAALPPATETHHPDTEPVSLPEMVRFRPLIGDRGDLENLVLGVRAGASGLEPVTISLYELFHTIVAASSGWGKSVFANSLLTQLATCPQPVELIVIDQQAHGLAAFRNCDRLRYPLLRDPGEILSALRETYQEAIGRRSELLARYDADDLAEYNQRASEWLPPVVVAVDEASALLASDKDIAAELKRQAWELRKFGVYQILCLTSAKGTTIDTDHRQQFSSKVQMRASDRHQARLLMDAAEAVTFPKGRALVDLPGQAPAVIQTPFIDKREVRALLRTGDRWRETSPPVEVVEVYNEEKTLTERQLQAVALWDSGERNLRAIAQAVYGYDASKLRASVKNALVRSGRTAADDFEA